MANDPQPPAATAKTPAPAQSAPAQSAPTTEEAPTLELNAQQWADQARTTFGVSPHAIAGALHSVAPSQLLSEDQVRGLLDRFSVREGIAS